MQVYAANVGNSLYWVHELVLVVICTFGGGLVAPLLLGKPALVLNNDLIIFFCILWWYCVFYLKGHVWLNYTPVKTVWLLFVGLFRTTAVTNIVTTATGVLAPTAYYPLPVFGPIIAGTALGSVGMFMPFDKGLVAIKNNGPWTMQAAFYTSCFYHFMINDTKGFIGQALRMMLGNLSRNTVLLIIAVLQISHLELQYYISPESNLFTPVHKLLYLIFQVNGPKAVQKPPVNGISAPVGWDRNARRKTRILLDLLRITFIFTVILLHVFFHVPPISIKTELLTISSTQKIPFQQNIPQQWTITDKEYESFAIHSLKINETIGSCQFLHTLRNCQSYLLRFEEVQESSSYRLALYHHGGFKYLIQNKPDEYLNEAKVYASIPLGKSVSNIFNDSEFLMSHQDKSLQVQSVSLHFSPDGWVVLLKPIRVTGQTGVTVFSYPVGHVSTSSASSDATDGACGEIDRNLSQATTEEVNRKPQRMISSFSVHPVNGKLIAYCENKNKEEL